jgi:hypothetical protein
MITVQNFMAHATPSEFRHISIRSVSPLPGPNSAGLLNNEGPVTLSEAAAGRVRGSGKQRGGHCRRADQCAADGRARRQGADGGAFLPALHAGLPGCFVLLCCGRKLSAPAVRGVLRGIR